VKKAQNKKQGLIFVISGPSGSGKTTLRDRLLQDQFLKKVLAKSVSITTRPRRSGERSGRDYTFVTETEFLRQKRADQILEYTRYLGHYYATTKGYLAKQLSRGKNIVLCLDHNGVRAIKKLYPRSSVSVFVAPPSLAVLKGRISRRCQRTTCKEINQRLKLARAEIARSKQYDYRIVNRDLDRSVNKLKIIVKKYIQQYS
jgi:guanylate kinase